MILHNRLPNEENAINNGVSQYTWGGKTFSLNVYEILNNRRNNIFLTKNFRLTSATVTELRISSGVKTT